LPSELAQISTDSAKGNPPVPPAQLALFNYPTSLHGGFRRRSAKQTLQVARQIEAPDVVAADGSPVLRRGVAKDRRISIEDPTRRHGRKSHSQKFNGYKRHTFMFWLAALSKHYIGKKLVDS
jgi:hypothetical protein